MITPVPPEGPVKLIAQNPNLTVLKSGLFWVLLLRPLSMHMNREKMLAGAPLTAERIEAAAQLAAKLAKPMDNTDMTLGFRKKMVTRFVEQALKEALEK
jgi:hypothetical protein